MSLQLAWRGLVPERALVPVAARRDDVADGAVVDALHRLEVALLVAALRAGDDAEAFFFAASVGRQHRADAGAVDRDRLLGEDVLAGGDGGLEVQSAGSRAASPGSRS